MEIKESARKRRNARNNRRKKANRKLAKLRSVVTPTLPDQMIKNEGASAGIRRNKRKHEAYEDDEIQESPNKKIKMDLWK